MTAIKLVLSMSENWTIWDPRDASAAIEGAVKAEQAGFDGVLFSEHLVLGRGSDANGVPANPRAFAMPANQEPSYPWPSSIVLMSAAARVTSRVRIIGAGVIAPLRHPLLLAKELGTLDLLADGRLVILPTVSWHRAEYDALGVSFERRGDILDEQLEVLRAVWAQSPVTHHGEFFDFEDVWLEPKASTPQGPAMWFGGATMHARLTKRLINYGSGMMCTRPLPADELQRVTAELTAAGRDINEIEFVSGIGGRFSGPDATADLDAALAPLGSRIRAGYTTFLIKPCQFIDDAAHLGEFLEEVVTKADDIAAQHG